MKEKDLFLIVCAGSKNESGEVPYHPPDAFDMLSENGAQRLEAGRICAREVLIEKYPGYELGPVEGFDPNFNKEQHEDQTNRYLPAYHRYSGSNSKFYSKVSSIRMEELTRRDNMAVVILCPLYGIELLGESILDHEAPTSNPPTRCWSRILTDILIDFIEENNIGRVFDMLTISPFTKLITETWYKILDRFDGDVYHNETGEVRGYPKSTFLGQFFNQYVCTETYDEAIDHEVIVEGRDGHEYFKFERHR